MQESEQDITKVVPRDGNDGKSTKFIKFSSKALRRNFNHLYFQLSSQLFTEGLLTLLLMR